MMDDDDDGGDGVDVPIVFELQFRIDLQEVGRKSGDVVSRAIG